MEVASRSIILTLFFSRITEILQAQQILGTLNHTHRVQGQTIMSMVPLFCPQTWIMGGLWRLQNRNPLVQKRLHK